MEQNQSNINFGNQPQGLDKKLFRSTKDRIFTGLCGGIAEYKSFDPYVIRFVLLFSLFITPFSFLGYFITSAFIPTNNNPEIDECILKRNKRFIFGSLSIFIGIFFILKNLGFWNDHSFFIIPNELFISIVAIFSGLLILLYSKNAKPLQLPKYFVRSSNNKKFLGVCGGFANYLLVDVKLVRILFIVLSILTLGLALLIYFYLAMKTKTDFYEHPQS